MTSPLNARPKSSCGSEGFQHVVRLALPSAIASGGGESGSEVDVAVGTRVSSRAPRTEPYRRLSRIRLPPWVGNGEAIARPRIKDDRFWEEGIHQLRHPCPRHPILLATPPQRAPPEPRPPRYLIFRGSIPHPMQSLCTLRNHCRQRLRNTRYQADATPYLGRSFTGWIAPACGWRTYSITSSAVETGPAGSVRPSDLAALRLTTNSNFVACRT